MEKVLISFGIHWVILQVEKAGPILNNQRGERQKRVKCVPFCQWGWLWLEKSRLMYKCERKCPQLQCRSITFGQIDSCCMPMTKEKCRIKSHLHIKCIAEWSIVALQDIIIPEKTRVYWHFQPIGTMAFIFVEPLPLLQAADAKTSGSFALLPPGGNRFNHLIKQGCNRGRIFIGGAVFSTM